MPSTDENFSILLSVIQSARDVIFRIDQDGECLGIGPAPIETLTLHNCDGAEKEVASLRNAVGQQITIGEYQDPKAAGRVAFYIECEKDDFEIRCDHVTSEQSAYTLPDLLLKSATLARLSREAWGQVREAGREYIGLTDRIRHLENFVRQEINRSIYKKSFFGATKPQLTGAVEAKKEVYERILKMLEDILRADSHQCSVGLQPRGHMASGANCSQQAAPRRPP